MLAYSDGGQHPRTNLCNNKREKKSSRVNPVCPLKYDGKQNHCENKLDGLGAIKTVYRSQRRASTLVAIGIPGETSGGYQADRKSPQKRQTHAGVYQHHRQCHCDHYQPQIQLSLQNRGFGDSAGIALARRFFSQFFDVVAAFFTFYLTWRTLGRRIIGRLPLCSKSKSAPQPLSNYGLR